MADNIIGEIKAPDTLEPLISQAGENSEPGDAIFVLLSRIFTLVVTIAGIYFVIQILLAGFAYISANGDPKKTEAAWAKIYQSIIGLAIVSSTFIIAEVIGKIVGFENILNPGVKPLSQ